MASIVAILLNGTTGFVTIILGFIYFVLAILVGVPLLTAVITLYLFTILLFKGVFIYFISTIIFVNIHVLYAYSLPYPITHYPLANRDHWNTIQEI